ncbi:MAG: type I-E CRISPR-associated protein Cas5/CasD, partial [Treponema sp.]
METKTILLWLEAPLQSWGYDSKFNRRDTLEFPTKSGVLGLVLCAMGYSGEQKELLARFASLKQTVISFRYVDKNGNAEEKQPLLHDFQMIGSGYDEKDEWQKNLIPKTSEGKPPVGGGTKLTHRYYLQNAVFAVMLETPCDLVDKVAESLKNPVFPIYLGRRCCVPTDYVFQGIFNDEKDAEDSVLKKATAKGESRDSLEKY